MTLDEAIIHYEEVADGHDRIKQIKAVTLEECKRAYEHRQLAEWLRELKAYKEQTDGDLISRQAVIYGINTYINKAQSTGTIDHFISFEELVVKALPSVKLLKNEQTDGDLISRQAVINKIAILSNEQGNKLVEAIKDIPSAEKTAEWVYRGNNIICSNCGEKIPYGINNHYCRNCGRRMAE